MTVQAHTYVVRNATEEQIVALEAVFAYMNALGADGSSRSITLAYDGDGRARLRIAGVEGEGERPLSYRDAAGRTPLDFDGSGNAWVSIA